jgi:hypothetical protein
VTLLTALLLAGCNAEPAIIPTAQTKTEQLASRDDLTLALESLRQLAQGSDEQSRQRTIFYLNQWLASTRASAGDWKPDPMLATLPRDLQLTLGLERLDELQFRYEQRMPAALMAAIGGDPSTQEAPSMPGTDLAHLQTCLWLHDIMQRARRTQVPPELADWLKAVEPELGVAEAEQLATAERLFDWTIRNIQLDELPPPPKGAQATPGARTDPVAPAFLGQPGPGYRHSSEQILLEGHADAWERARVFILLCRQAQIDAVMLGLMEESSPTPRGWLPAVLLKGDLYLFDTTLGLPIPGPGGKGIATLAQALDEEQVLRQLDVEGQPYPLEAKDLKIAALIDAEPDSLSRRMQLLQGALPAEQHLMLAVRPSILEPKLRKCRGVGQVNLWRVPFEAVLYHRFGRGLAAASDPAFAKFNFVEGRVFHPDYPLAKGRNLHLQGRFEKEDEQPGARTFYLSSRQSDQSINRFESSQVLREAAGIQQQLPKDEKQQKEMVETFANIARTQKHNATYWLGLTYHEAGNQAGAIEWLADRTMEAFPPSPWIPGARYNLARCYEDLGQWDAARKWLESDKDSPQRHGNLLRAKWIAQRHPEAAATPSAADEAAPKATTAEAASADTE